MLMRFLSRDSSTVTEGITPAASQKRLSGVWKPRNSTNSLRSKHPAEIMSGRPELAVEFQPGFTHQWTHPGVTLQAEPCLCWALCCGGSVFFHGGNGKDVGGIVTGLELIWPCICVWTCYPDCFCSQWKETGILQLIYLSCDRCL